MGSATLALSSTQCYMNCAGGDGYTCGGVSNLLNEVFPLTVTSRMRLTFTSTRTRLSRRSLYPTSGRTVAALQRVLRVVRLRHKSLCLRDKTRRSPVPRLLRPKGSCMPVWSTRHNAGPVTPCLMARLERSSTRQSATTDARATVNSSAEALGH